MRSIEILNFPVPFISVAPSAAISAVKKIYQYNVNWPRCQDFKEKEKKDRFFVQMPAERLQLLAPLSEPIPIRALNMELGVIDKNRLQSCG